MQNQAHEAAKKLPGRNQVALAKTTELEENKWSRSENRKYQRYIWIIF